jgi:large repetitive protein
VTTRRLRILLPIVALLVVTADAPAGGIDDQPCPNVAGENTNTCPSGTVGVPYAIRFVEREGSGCGPGRQTFHVDSGIAPPGLTLALDGTLSGSPQEAGRFRFYVEMREPKDDPTTCAGKETQKEFTLMVRKPVAIVSPPSLLQLDLGKRIRTPFRASGGSGGFQWSLVRGLLPRGVRLRRGALRGAPRASGVYRLTVRVTDTELRSATWTGALVVRRPTVR